MTTLTAATLLVIAVGALGWIGFGSALGIGGATAAGAAFVVGGTAVPTFYAVSIGAAVAVVVRAVDTDSTPRGRHLPPGVPLLVAFLLWSVLVTLVSPVLFDGLAVMRPGAEDSELSAGMLASSNVAQMAYLALGVSVVVFLARTTSAGPGIIGLAVGTATLLSMWRYLYVQLGLPFPEGVFDNTPFYVYIESAPGGIERFRGILSEPAALAASSLLTISYVVSRLFQVKGWRRVGLLLVGAIATYLGFVSTSTTFVVAGVAVATIGLGVFSCSFFLRGRPVSVLASVLVCSLALFALWLLPILAAFVELTIDGKVSSSSYDERTGANSHAYSLVFDTWGIGTGLGSNRASSFFAGILGTTGIVGTLLFAGAVIVLIRGALSDPRYLPVVWSLITCLIVKIISGPDLSETSGVLWLSLGLLAQASVQARGDEDSPRTLGSRVVPRRVLRRPSSFSIAPY